MPFMEANPHGWKTRAAQARAKRMRHARSKEELTQIREIRRRHMLESAGLGEEGKPAPKIESPAPAAQPGRPDPDGMTWQQMADELRAAGKFVPPKIGEEKLRLRLREKRDAEISEKG